MPSSSSGAPRLPPPTVPAPVPSLSPGPVMYKNRLQEFTSRSGTEVPIYQTVNEGQPHIPKFRSTVWVAGISYTSESTFSQKKAAEQEAARLALETILQKTREEGPSLVSEISPLCKSIINEYAAKLHIEGPSYNTVQQQIGGVLPVFTSSLVFNGTSYTGDPARTKKEAEQSAAQAAILSIMGDSNSGIKLFEIIKSKSIFYDAIKGKGLSLLQASEVLSAPDSKHISVTPDPKEAAIPDSVADNSEVKVECTESSKIHSTCQKQESSLQDTLPLEPGSADSIDNDLSSKRRKKNKKKANKKSRLESPIPITAL
ncbi:double-stranded RNA-binding protein 4-like [Vigna unguiculata]|uniref:double-stranded RNA-binding protein 4-like n=1 Tax=Vigna unguiculata TaxID=3917 RepID=UPI001016F07F|nr:double-stranded RNA-binding protein 4-like [Vigna unguiculata]